MKKNQESKSFGVELITLSAHQKVLNGFVTALMSAEKQIKYRPVYMDHDLRKRNGELSFMPMVIHPTERIALKTGELAVTRSPHPNPNKQHLNTAILMRGTQYGVLIIFGRENAYTQQSNGNFEGPLPELHATGAFYGAAQRFFKRRGVKFNLMTDSEQLLEWIFSDSFVTDMQEQVYHDTEARILVGDGLPRKPDRITVRKAEVSTRSTKPTTRKLDRKDLYPTQVAA